MADFIKIPFGKQTPSEAGPPSVERLPTGRSVVFHPDTSLPFAGFVESCGHEERRTDYRLDWARLPGTLPRAVFQFTVAGRGHLRSGRRQWDLVPGSAMLLITPGPYEYRLPPDSESWRFVFVTLCGEGLVGVWRWIIEKTGPVAVLPDDSEPVLLACEICRRGQAGAFDDLFLSADFAHRLAVSLSAAVLPGQHPAAIPPELSEARDFLVAHMADPLLSIPDVARAVGVGTNRLIRLFRDHTGTTPRAFLEQRRVERACFLLSATAMTVCKISETCGFSSANYFTKVFRRTLGIPPGTYRRKCS